MSLYPPNAQNPYPKTKYAATGGSIVIEDAHHEQLLGPGWSDNPYPAGNLITVPARDLRFIGQSGEAFTPAPLAETVIPIPVTPEPKKRSKAESIEGSGGGTWPAAKGGN